MTGFGCLENGLEGHKKGGKDNRLRGCHNGPAESLGGGSGNGRGKENLERLNL